MSEFIRIKDNSAQKRRLGQIPLLQTIQVVNIQRDFQETVDKRQCVDRCGRFDRNQVESEKRVRVFDGKNRANQE